MMDDIQEDKTWEGLDWRSSPLKAGAFDQCHFVRCQLSGVSLMGYHFTDCRFTDCDLSNVDLRGVVFNDVSFHGCKLTGAHFEECHQAPFGVRFEDCNLMLASFTGLMLKKTQFSRCRLRETDFSKADLREALFTGSDLDRAIFSDCNLERADFRKSLNCSLDPARNRMRRAKFSLDGLPGLLSAYGLDIE